MPGYKGYDHPTADGAIFQILQAAVDTGIAAAAIDDGIRFVQSKARAWVDSGRDKATEDLHTIQAIGDLSVRACSIILSLGRRKGYFKPLFIEKK